MEGADDPGPDRYCDSSSNSQLQSVDNLASIQKRKRTVGLSHWFRVPSSVGRYGNVLWAMAIPCSQPNLFHLVVSRLA